MRRLSHRADTTSPLAILWRGKKGGGGGKKKNTKKGGGGDGGGGGGGGGGGVITSIHNKEGVDTGCRLHGMILMALWFPRMATAAQIRHQSI